MEPTEKIKKSFISTVEHSNVPYILILKEVNNLTLLASSPKSALVLKDIKDFVSSGAIISYINNMSNLPIGKILSDIIYYKGSQIELYGETIDTNLYLIQLNTQEYLNNKSTIQPVTSNPTELTRNIYELRSSIKEAFFYIDNLKKDLDSSNKKVNEIESKLEIVEDKLVVELKTLQTKVETLQEKLIELKDVINGLKNNSLLKFTSDLDFKKTVALIGLLISIFSSAGLFEGWVSSSIDNSNGELEGKIEKLLELSED